MKSLLNVVIGAEGDLGRQIVGGSAWMALCRVAVQLSSLVQLAIMARFLEPGDFGLMAIVLLVLNILDTFTTTGFHQALVQRQGPIDDYLSSVFVANVIRGAALSAAIILVGPFAATFFGEPSVASVIRLAAVVTLLRALQNPAFVRVHREMRFKHYFVWNLAKTVAILAATVALAPVLRNVWAPLFAMILGELTATIGSYILAPWRPQLRVQLQDILELSRFGRWVTASTIVYFLSLQLDNIVVGRMLGTTALGLYEVAFRISHLPATEISNVVGTAAFPALSRVAGQPDRFRTIYLRLVRVLWTINLVVAGLLIAFAGPIVHYALGEQWHALVPALRILAIAGLARSLINVGGNVFYAAGHPKFNLLMNVVRLTAMAGLLIPLVSMGGIEGAAFAVLLSISCAVPLYLIFIQRAIGLRPREHLTDGLSGYPHLLSRIRRSA